VKLFRADVCQFQRAQTGLRKPRIPGNLRRDEQVDESRSMPDIDEVSHRANIERAGNGCRHDPCASHIQRDVASKRQDPSPGGDAAGVGRAAIE